VAVMVTLELRLKPEKLDEFLGIMTGSLKDTRAYDGCQSVDTYVDTDVAGRVLLVEQWDTRGQQEKYIQWRTDSGMMEALADFVTAPPVISYHEARPDV
jgi:quinol monooxygenase YgiN